MRLIVSCSQCCRRYDAAGRRSGSKFRCLCGESLVVSSPKGHDAAVVRCSSCGAPREKATDACGFCHSDFTLHERDLHTVCPSCFTRVSDKARYCHHCATPIFADNVAGEKTEWTCPSCKPKRRLMSRRLGDHLVAMLECQRCAGLWLGMESLQAMLSAEARGEKRDINQSHSKKTLTDVPQTSRGYRPCVVCDNLMTRRNLGRGKSGVVVDLCGHHGVWFDAEELTQLIAWTRTGGLEELRRDLARLVGSKDDIRKRHAYDEDQPQLPVSIPWTPKTTEKCEDPEWLNVIAYLVTSVFRR